MEELNKVKLHQTAKPMSSHSDFEVARPILLSQTHPPSHRQDAARPPIAYQTVVENI